MKKAETSQRILGAALKCISEQGCANVGLREIAREADVVTSQLSYYFKNKEGLFSEVLKLIRQHYLDELKVVLGPATSFHDKLLSLISHNQKILASKEPRHRAFLDFFNLAMWSPSFKSEMQEFLNEIYSAIEIDLQSAVKKSGKPPPYPIPLLSRLIMATTFGASMQQIMDPDSPANLKSFDIFKLILGSKSASKASR